MEFVRGHVARLGEDPFVLAACKDHPLAAKPSVGWADLEPHRGEQMCQRITPLSLLGSLYPLRSQGILPSESTE
ncbi:hypothetical protein BWO76_02730 (plasmid) [Sinorhizobium meliloti]|nr:hypothetical protein BWO76_02730 [Sinorhizobium meliloti]